MMIFFSTVLSIFIIVIITMRSAGASAAHSLTLSEQASQMPEDFRVHLFNSPLSARIMLNGKILGDAVIMLTLKNTVQIINFTDSYASPYGENERQKWLEMLTTPVELGDCATACPGGLIAMNYNLSTAQLSLLTSSSAAGENLHHPLPEENSNGLLLSNQLNLSAGKGTSSPFSWSSGVETALGKWSGVSQFQLSRNGDEDDRIHHQITSLYLQRELNSVFIRSGQFSPDSQGVLRQPYLSGGGSLSLAGLMAGSSDTLMKEGSFPSRFPVYVTANRESVAEIYRNNTLIHTQQVQPGLHLIDTLPLPVGIYQVEIRLKEDGREVSRETQTINKPQGWRNPAQRLRYNVYAGRETLLLRRPPVEDVRMNNVFGSSLNWLIQPNLTGGLAGQSRGKEQQAGVSLDWAPREDLQLYNNFWHSNLTGNGFSTQTQWRHQKGSVGLNHSRSWYYPVDKVNAHHQRAPVQNTHQTSVSARYRLDYVSNVNTRLSQRSSAPGIGVDLGYGTRTTLSGTEISWELSAFDRPYSNNGNARNRGAGLSASFALGGGQRSASASIGSRNDSRGGRDLYASATLNQKWMESAITESSATISTDRYGVGLSNNNNFQSQYAQGNFWGQSTPRTNALQGGVNLNSTLAIAGDSIVLSPHQQFSQGGGMIVNVESDVPRVALNALHEGGNTPLKAGKNFIPLDAWKPGVVQFDFPGSEAPELKISPERLDYHVIRGGVQSQTVRVMKTVTVLGRIVDAVGSPLGGAHVINHAGRTLTERDGMFTLQLHEGNPVISVEHHTGAKCELTVPTTARKQDGFVFVDNLICGGLVASGTSATQRQES